MKIGFDVDDLIAGFYLAFCIKHKKPLEKRDIWADTLVGDHYWELVADKEFWANLPAIMNAKEIDFEIDCYISDLPQELYDVRVKWLKDNGFPDAPLFLTREKLRVIEERDLDWFVDDKAKTIKMINESGLKCRGIQYTPFYHEMVDEVSIYQATCLADIKRIAFIDSIEELKTEYDIKLKEINRLGRRYVRLKPENGHLLIGLATNINELSAELEKMDEKITQLEKVEK